MKFLVVLCLLAVAAADEEKTQEKKTQSVENTQNKGLTQPTGSLLNSQLSQVFPATGFPNPISNFAYTGFNTPIQTVNPDFFNTGSANPVVNAGIPSFPVTRTVLPGTAAGIQSAFPVQGGAFPLQGGAFPAQGGVFPGVQGIASQFAGAGTNFLSTVAGVPGVTNGALDTNTATNGALSAGNYRFLTPETISGIATQGLQSTGIPAFASGILSTLPNGIFQGQTIPTGVLKNPTAGTTSGISNIPALSTGNISSGPLTNVFRTA